MPLLPCSLKPLGGAQTGREHYKFCLNVLPSTPYLSFMWKLFSQRCFCCLQPPLPEEIGGPLKGYRLSYKKKSDSGWNKATLDPDLRRYTIVGLSVAEIYQVKLLAFNDQGDGPSTPLYEATTGELGKMQPQLLEKGIIRELHAFFIRTR